MSQPQSSQRTMEIETAANLKAIAKQFPLLLIHRITSSDLELQSTQNHPFPFAWYGNAFNTKNTPHIQSLQSFPSRAFSNQPLPQETKTYPDLNHKIAQQNTLHDILNTTATHLPQWFQCCVCRKWRIHFVSKQYFPLLDSPPKWQCNHGAPPLNQCFMAQCNPTHHVYNNIQLNALRIQREIKKKNVQDAPDTGGANWMDMAHHLLDRIIRKFDAQHAIIYPFIHFNNHQTYYKSIAQPISIHSLKHELEKKSIKSFAQFGLKLVNMLRQAMSHSNQKAITPSIHANAGILHFYCCKLVKQLELGEIANLFTIISTAPITPSPPPKVLVTSHYYYKTDKEDMPALEKSKSNCNNDQHKTVVDLTETHTPNHSAENAMEVDNDDNDKGNTQDHQEDNEKEADSNHNAANDDNHNDNSNTDNNNNNSNTNQCHNDNSDNNDEKDNEKEADDDGNDTGVSPSKTKGKVLPKLSLQVAHKPESIDPEDTFENVQMFKVLADKWKMIIHQIKIFDEQQHFFKDVQHKGYTDIIKKPIHFGQILHKIDENDYDIMRDITDDIELLWCNCFVFNGKPDADKPIQCGFSNYASELQWALNQYKLQFIEILKLRGYIDDNETHKMERICDQLRLGNISANRLYHFKTRLEIYQCVERLFEQDVAGFKLFINNKTSNFCRDMKNAMNVKGPVIPLPEIRRTIIARFKKLKKELHGTCSPNGSPVALKKRCLSVKKRYCILDSDTESDADSVMASNNVHTNGNRQTMNRTLGKIRYCTNKDGTKVRLGMDCPFPGCDAALQCMYGVHDYCFAKTKMVQCNHCKFILSNTNMAYYHCIDGCLDTSQLKHQYYLCLNCASQHCHSPQKYLSSHSDILAFHGVWIFMEGDTCEIMIMLQDSNRISWQYKRESAFASNVFHGSIEDVSDSKTVVLDIDVVESMQYTSALWQYHSDVDVRLIFNAENDGKMYHKLSPICADCKCLMQFLYKKTFPNYAKRDNIKCCDDFNQYDYMKYATLKAMKYVVFHDGIYENDFYFYCTKCNGYSICGGCALIKYEMEMNTRNKRRKRSSISEQTEDMRDDEVERLNKQLCKEQQRVRTWRDKANRVESERDYWRKKYEELSKSMHRVLFSFNNE